MVLRGRSRPPHLRWALIKYGLSNECFEDRENAPLLAARESRHRSEEALRMVTRLSSLTGRPCGSR